jgi:calcineurin-like phosphoesterase family protein
MYVWDRSHFDSWCLFGHTHGTVIPIGKSMDVGVDSNVFTPVSFEQIVQYMIDRPHNVNYLEVEK